MDASARNLAAAAVGGTLWAAVPALDGTVPWVWSLAPLAPVLLAFGVLECRRRYGDGWGQFGRAGAALAGVGLALLAVGALLRQALAGLVAVFAVGPVAAGGFLALWVGSTFLAVALRRADVLGRPGAVAFVLALPASLLVNVFLGSAGLGLGRGVVRASPGFYGLAWVGLAVRLSRTGPTAARGTVSGPSAGSAVGSPQRVVAALVGVAVAVLGAAGLLPLGAPDGTPFTGESAPLDGVHAALGAAGVLAALAGDRYARWYNRAGGAALLALAALPFLPGRTPFGLAFVDLVVYVPAAVVTLGVGFAAGSATGSGPQRSGADDDVRGGGEQADAEDGRADRRR
ncbi:hypothetical protein [Halobacterium yunchengense]|uniref:hypothetical protein n=1 Tax=Halobacterium yunchengense TaxID=3108497 RepID=UPI00300A0299